MSGIAVVCGSAAGVPDGTAVSVEEAHALGRWHFSVHLLARDGDMLWLRRRSASEARYPGQFTTSVGYHLGAGQSPRQALATGATRWAVRFGQVSYAGMFEIDDGIEREACSLWATSDFDPPGHGPGDFGRYRPRDLDMDQATPHLRECLALLKELSSG